MQPSDIKPHMDVIGSDGARIGTVDHLDGDRIKLARGTAGDGQHHYVPLSAVSRVDSHVHLSATAAALGLAGAAAASGAASGGGHSALPPIKNPAVDDARPRRNYYLPWVLLALAVLALLFLLAKGVEEGRENRDRDDGGVENSTAAQPLAAERVELPNGRKVELAPGTLNYSLQRFLDSDEPTPRAFAFDNLNFDTASAAIRPADEATVDTLAQILKAYPDARVRVVGYTDAEGSASGNAALGQLRADAVAAALAGKGLAKGRVESATGGETDPLRSNRNRKGRLENRRTELVVLAK